MSPVTRHRTQPQGVAALGLTNPPYVLLRETHIGAVLLMGDCAYKFKKPVDVGFLDFRDRDRREAFCQREVELNRQFAPDVYLGVGMLSTPGEARAEPAVVMRRMPDDRRLSTLIAAGADLGSTVLRLARLMATFHGAARRSPVISAEGSRDAIRGRWSATFEQVAPFVGTVFDSAQFGEIRRRVVTFLAGRSAMFDRRLADGRIVDGHGDLICDDIFCLDDGPRVLDCLEFDDRLRYIDGLDDIAFLAMDMEKLGAAGPAALLLRRYADFAGDPAPPPLRHHYVAYRAFVRAKVDCLRFAQGDAGAAADAREYADLSLRHLRAGSVRILLIGGLPGTGKSTIAGAVADEIGAVLLSSDRIRKELSGLPPMRPAAEAYRRGLYDTEHTSRTYSEILRRAAALIDRGESVVIDASWSDPVWRGEAATRAGSGHAELLQVRCWAPPAVRQQRIRGRVPGPSDANSQIADRMEHDVLPWPEALVLRTDDTVEEAVARLLDELHIDP